MFADPLSQTYDVIVVGSGATGGWAAKRLSEAGIEVALLEAGRKVSPKEFTEHMPALQAEIPGYVAGDRAAPGQFRNNATRAWSTTTTGS